MFGDFPELPLRVRLVQLNATFKKKNPQSFHIEGGKMFAVSIQYQGLKFLLH